MQKLNNKYRLICEKLFSVACKLLPSCWSLFSCCSFFYFACIHFIRFFVGNRLVKDLIITKWNMHYVKKAKTHTITFGIIDEELFLLVI